MYTIEGKPRTRVGADGTVREETAPCVELSTAAGLLRWALNSRVFAHHVGGVPYPTRFDDCYLGYRDGDKGHDYHLVDTFSLHTITSAHLTTMRRAQRRYLEIVHYLREVEPEWQETRRISYMDNSVVAVETNKYGQTRNRAITPPSGDACF